MKPAALAFLLAASAFAQAPPLEPLGLALENHPYPHPVQFFPVTVPDQLGFGKSAKPDVHYSFELLAQRTKALLDRLGVARATVVTRSMGGMLAFLK